MGTPIGAKRKEPRKPLRRTTPLKKMSDKAKAELKMWLEIKKQRMEALREKYGAILCEKCGIATYNGVYAPEAHHNDRNRRNNTLENARILHIHCHRFVHDNNVKDIPSLL